MQSSSRNGAKVLWIAIHTTEGIMRARDLLAWTSWSGSSHASNDETGVLLGPEDGFVSYERASWTLRNGNPYSDNLEQCAWARWSRPEWLSRPKLIDTTAQWIADRHKARPWIPITKLSPREVGAGRPGVIGHVDYTLGTGDGTHTDPGPNYPWDVVIDKARAYAAGSVPSEEDDMAFIVMRGSQPWLKDGLHYQALADTATVNSLKALGAKTLTVGERDHARWLAAFLAATGQPAA